MIPRASTWQRTSGGVTAPRGYLASGVHCGIKPRKRDLALVVSEAPASVAGVFTTNRVKAAPVLWCQEVVRRGVARAVVVNSGNANACTGERGWLDAREMAERTAAALGVAPEEVLVASTGVIGVPLPMDAVRRGIPLAAASLSRSGEEAAEAILTTDAFPKTSAVVTTVGGVQVTVGGMAKGAGMIHPRLATTLCFLTTDAYLPAPVLREALSRAVGESFNRITVDGDTSTNDTVLALANGRAGAPVVEGGEDLERFTQALTAVAQDLARMVVRDGEGAQRLVEVVVEGAADEQDADRAAFAIATSLLVKTMLHGGEPNWGRVVAAVGYSGAQVDERRVAVWFGDVQVVREGLGVEGVFDRAAAALRGEEVTVRVDLGLGTGRARVWTCDLGEEYVRINGSYIT